MTYDRSRDGTLNIDGEYIEDVRSPGWAESEIEGVRTGHETVGTKLKWTITRWTDHRNDPLFRKPNMDIGDIAQESVGDCWYLAALMSILSLKNGSDLLKNTMFDDGKGKVVVRLYDKTITPHYLRISKRVLWHSGFGRVHVTGLGKTGLWAAMLEKAACCMTEDGVCHPNNPDYKNIEGGYSHAAFRMLLGVPSSREISNNLNFKGAVGEYTAERHLGRLFDRMYWQGPHPEIQVNNVEALNAVFGIGKVTADVWQRIVAALNAQNVDRLWTTYDERKTPRAPSDEWLTMLPFCLNHWLHKFPNNIKYDLLSFHSKYLSSGASGTGKYSAGAIHWFLQVKDKLNNGCPVSVATPEHVGPAQRLGHSGGEKMSHGMVGHHGYPVLEVGEGSVMKNQRYWTKWVKIANPWNSYGRTYSVSENGQLLTPKEQKSGVFWIELKDLCDVINATYWTDRAPKVGSLFAAAR
jgi:hypothetical protein